MMMSQVEMCKKMGITQSHYSKIERREKIISYESFITLCDNGGDIDFLVTGIKTQATELDDLFYQCPETQRESILKLMVIYVNLALDGQKEDAHLCYTREIEILKFDLAERIHENHNTVWKYMRGISGLTQEKMAAELGIDVKSYREIEKENTMPNVAVLVKLFEKYGYYPSLISKTKTNYLLMLNKIWIDLSANVKKKILSLLKEDLKYILELSK
jgi:transcriptional regulator with XRE-family HTH domain